MKKFAKYFSLALALCMIFALGACGSSNTDASTTDTGSTDTGATEKTTLVLGTSADYPPFEFHVLDADGNDTIVGLDVALAQQIADDMGLELVIKDISFDYLVQELSQGNVDIVIAAIERNDERDAVVDFSDPYYTDYPAMVLVNAADADLYTGWDSFGGLTVGAQNGSTKADMVTSDMPGASLLALASVTDLVNNLVNNKCAAILVDGAVAMQYADAMDELVVADLDYGETPEPYRVAIEEGDPQGLVDAINATIASVVDQGLVAQWSEDANALSDQAIGLE